MKRKEFLKKIVAGSVIAIPSMAIIQSCGDDGGDDPQPTTPTTPTTPVDPPNCIDNGTSTNIGANHGHSITVSKTAVKEGKEKVYSIKGSGTHDHTVIITAAHFQQLAGGGTISVLSSSDNSHTHSVTVSCKS
ncbi:MAG: hypothetical protein RLO81_06110 [Fulvivirga sp.]|uniref:hypothetical protein n=1 Tax=Fulvivirga sp. TaxID=1931237 RepID=UPI0032EC6EE0